MDLRYHFEQCQLLVFARVALSYGTKQAACNAVHLAMTSTAFKLVRATAPAETRSLAATKIHRNTAIRSNRAAIAWQIAFAIMLQDHSISAASSEKERW
eukprot:15553-Heterococcus_DN1.PRE.1